MRTPSGGARINTVSAVIPMIDFAVIKFDKNNEKKVEIGGYFNEEWGLELAKP